MPNLSFFGRHQRRLAEFSIGAFGSIEFGVPDIRTFPIDAVEAGVSEVGTLEIGTGEVGASEVGATEGGFEGVDAGHLGVFKRAAI